MHHLFVYIAMQHGAHYAVGLYMKVKTVMDKWPLKQCF